MKLTTELNFKIRLLSIKIFLFTIIFTAQFTNSFSNLLTTTFQLLYSFTPPTIIKINAKIPQTAGKTDTTTLKYVS